MYRQETLPERTSRWIRHTWKCYEIAPQSIKVCVVTGTSLRDEAPTAKRNVAWDSPMLFTPASNLVCRHGNSALSRSTFAKNVLRFRCGLRRNRSPPGVASTQSSLLNRLCSLLYKVVNRIATVGPYNSPPEACEETHMIGDKLDMPAPMSPRLVELPLRVVARVEGDPHHPGELSAPQPAVVLPSARVSFPFIAGKRVSGVIVLTRTLRPSDAVRWSSSSPW